MNGRALLAIGCDRYDNSVNFPPLTGAEADARAMFDALSRPDTGDYDPACSLLLLSPTIAELRNALAELIGGRPQTLTLAFAGHGLVCGASFYLCPRDATMGALSFTALSLGDLLRMITEAEIAQTYIILDACEAGGLTSDLNVILKSDVIGRGGTPGLSLLAMAASDQEAIERGGQGVGTAALLDCITGAYYIQDSSPALDLVEIGRAVSARLAGKEVQTPLVWGLNLCGPAGFCKNPHAGTGNAPLRQVIHQWPDAKTVEIVRASLPKLWEDYATIAKRWEPRRLVDRLQSVFADLTDIDAIIALSRTIADSFAIEVAQNRDRFREVELRAACLASLLPHSDDRRVEAYLRDTGAALAALAIARLQEVVAAVDRYPHALLTGGMGDLFYLPMRLSSLLGWAGFAVHLDHFEGETLLNTLLDLFLRHYELSLIAMSDGQAPMALLAFTALARSASRERGEQLYGYMLQSAFSVGGLVARANLSPERVLDYLLRRHRQTLAEDRPLIAQPSELMMVLLRCARLFELVDEVDVHLSQIDHLTVSAFLPDGYRAFAADDVPNGVNAVFAIGHEIFRVGDLDTRWPACARPDGPGQAAAIMAACLVFPDRSPWFLLPSPSVIDAEVSIQQ